MNPNMSRDSGNLSREKFNDLKNSTLKGEWDIVKDLYKNYPQAHKAIISESNATALHVAIDLDKEDVVKELVKEILERDGNDYKALKIENEQGNTPLHFAASKGFVKICECIIGYGDDHNKRIDLLTKRNKLGETPLFQAALNWRKETFAYLVRISRGTVKLFDLQRNDGDTILHTAIREEYFDLAVIIVDFYEFQNIHLKLNNKKFTPLKVLATRPSGFKSSCNYSWYKRILYHCIHVEQLDADKTLRSYWNEKNDSPDSDKWKPPQNCTTLYNFVSISFSAIATLLSISNGKKDPKKKSLDSEDPQKEKDDTLNSLNVGSLQKCLNFLEKKASKKNSSDDKLDTVGSLPPNYETFHHFVKCAYAHILGIFGVEISDEKKNHVWSRQLLNALLKNPSEAYTGDGASRPDIIQEIKGKEKENKNDEKELINKKRYTPFLVAARYGIVEMVKEIKEKRPSVIHETNPDGENAMFIAVKYKQPLIIDTLMKNTEEILWKNLMLEKDNKENTALHLAAAGVEGAEKPWQIAGSALQLMWNIKWFEYIKEIVPHHFYFRTNSEGKTPRDMFRESQKTLMSEGSGWLKDTSESCSVVAALVAGVSFATASTVPGGTSDEGTPILEGKPAFDAFAIASLVGLCFSVTGLIMFLSILTSRKEGKDFRRDLPLKLLIGLSSLFVAIASMFISFCTGHFFLLSHRFHSVLLPIYGATCLPVTFFAFAQFPLYYDLIMAIFTKVPTAPDKGHSL